MMTITHIAAVCHEVNRAYCITTGDYSQYAWKDAPTWQRTKVIHGVGYVIANPEVTVEDLHNNWMNEMVAEGWVYGERKDSSAKTHPAMLPYEKVSHTDKVKDALFLAVVRASMLYPS